jgi:hypothetical protein
MGCNAQALKPQTKTPTARLGLQRNFKNFMMPSGFGWQAV